MNGANAYKQAAVTTASRGQLLIMLYEAAIRNVRKAADAIDARDLAGKGKHIVKAHDIVNELNNSLNFDVGGEVTRDLERLYQYMAAQLLKANMENSKEPLLTVQKLLETLLSGWRVAVEQFQKAQSPGQAGAGSLQAQQAPQKG
jgi:flagellar protein FliS